jgi:hypothetical protein
MKKLLFYRLRFLDSVETEPITDEEAKELLAEADRRFRHMSYGLFGLEWTVTPQLQLDQPMDYYRQLGFYGILFEARKAAAAAGYPLDDFDLDIAFSPQIPTFPAGQAIIGQKGVLAHQKLPALFVHELGHSLGLYHANSWELSALPLSSHSTPPFPSNVSEYPEPLRFDPASLLGNGDLRSPGRSIEYGDFFDPMGGSTGDFNPSYKRRLRWLQPTQIQTVQTSGVYRIYAFDSGSSAPDQQYALRLPGIVVGRGQNYTFQYWVSYRSAGTPPDISVPQGIQLHWMDPTESYTSQLLDFQPFSPLRAWDSTLPLGRSFTDAELGLTVTALTSGKDELGPWVDVQIHLRNESQNRPPSLTLDAPLLEVDPGTEIEVRAIATDPDGDDVLFYWELGDGQFTSGRSQVRWSWPKPGHYVVRCEASDGKGGVTSEQVLITVGQPDRYVISGQVRMADGQPVADVYVTNGKVDPINGMLFDHVIARTDSAGHFFLTGLLPDTYQTGAQGYGWLVSPEDEDGTVEVGFGKLAVVNFIAQAIPSVAISGASRVEEGQEIELTVRRFGDLSDDLPVDLAWSGNAGHGQDFVSLTGRRLVIRKGNDSATVRVQALTDIDDEQDEELVLNVLPAGDWLRQVAGGGVTTEVTYYYPGWEPQGDGKRQIWFQTAPGIRRDATSSFRTRILDTTPDGLQRVSMINQIGISYERPSLPVPVRVTRVGSTEAPLEVRLKIEGTATNGEDYETVPNSVSIPVGASFVDVTVVPISDGQLEGSELVELTLVPGEEYLIDGNSYVFVAIQEDEFNSSPNRLDFGFRFGGDRVLRMSGEAGKDYVLESSTDLQQWSPINTNRIDYSPIGLQIPPFVESMLFYRSRRLP